VASASPWHGAVTVSLEAIQPLLQDVIEIGHPGFHKVGGSFIQRECEKECRDLLLKNAREVYLLRVGKAT
jgi:hypothetical protein